MTLRAVVFDLDGLMFNTEELYAEVGGELLRRRGRQVTPELLQKMMGRPGNVALQVMIDSHQLDATVDELQRETDELFPDLIRQRLRPMPGLLGLLEALERAAIPKAIATSSRRHYVDLLCEQAKMGERFEFVLTSDDVRQGKPHPEVYLAAARRWGLPPAEVMVLEDSEVGCAAGVAAGAFVVAVPAAHSAQHCFQGVALVADSLADRRIYQALGC